MSGNASRGIRCIDQMPAMTSRNVAVKTRNRLRAHHSIIHVITLHSSRGVDGERLAGNYAPVLAGGDCDLPSSPGAEIAFDLIHAPAFVGEIHADLHRRHAHGRHSSHEKGDIDLCTADGSSAGCSQLYAENIAALLRRGGIGSKLGVRLRSSFRAVHGNSLARSRRW